MQEVTEKYEACCHEKEDFERQINAVQDDLDKKISECQELQQSNEKLNQKIRTMGDDFDLQV